MEASLNSEQDEVGSTDNEAKRDLASESMFYDLAEESVLLHQKLKVDGFNMSKINALFERAPIKSSMDRVLLPELNDPSVQFTYDPLTEPDMIRVLLLHMGDEMAPLEGSMRHQILGPMIDYEPLSYAWGNESMTCSMLLNGRQMPLTQSLYDGLRRLRRHDRDRAVWADGVCINQADAAEKSVQVTMMPRIFDQTRVLAYLGEEADNSDGLLDLLEQLTTVESHEFSEQSIIEYDLPPLIDSKWWDLSAFLGRPWFKRLWVVPEVVCARDVRFLCGSWETGWRTMMNVAHIWSKLTGLPSCLDSNTPHQDKMAFEGAECLSIMLDMRLARWSTSRRIEDIRNRVNGKLDRPDQLITGCIEKRDFIVQACKSDPELFPWMERTVKVLPSSTRFVRTPLLKLFTIFMHSQVTKPQDRIYALVWLGAEITPQDFAADYEETIHEANVRFSRVLVEKGYGMDVLYHATKLATHVDLVPTWAADWTTPRTFDDHWMKLGWAYKSGFPGPKLASSQVSLVNSYVLKASGFRLDICQVPNVGFPTIDHKSWTPWCNIFIWDLIQNTEIFSDEKYFTGETWVEVLTRTLVAGDRSYEEEEAFFGLTKEHSEMDLSFSFTSIRLREAKRRQSRIVEWLQTMARKMNGYLMCKTSKCYMGLVPDSTIATDEVFMLEGSDMPFVLRPTLEMGMVGS